MSVQEEMTQLLEGNVNYPFTSAADNVRKLQAHVGEGTKRMSRALKAGELTGKRLPAGKRYIASGQKLLGALAEFFGALEDVEDSI